MSTRPVRLVLNPLGELIIDWADGERRRYSVDELRQHCPCASCQGHGPEAPVAPPHVEPGLAIRNVDPVGNYAYRITFSDGHETGIYTLQLLRGMGIVDNASQGNAP